MHLAVIGLNHRSAPLEIRESLAFTSGQVPKVLNQIGETLVGLRETLLLATCNRTEIYVICQKESDLTLLQSFLCHLSGHNLQDYLYVYQGDQCIKHLYQVTGGLDSLVIGECQVLGQVKEAYESALKYSHCGKYLSQLFREAIRVGKRLRTETAISQGAVSISHAAVELARRQFGSLANKKVLLVGAGEMAELAAKSLADHGAKTILVANRTYKRACNLAKQFGGKAVCFDSLQEQIALVDIVISSTGAPHLVIQPHHLKERGTKPLLMVDIALPRDINPQVGSLASVVLYNIDDLKSVVNKNLTQRQHWAQLAEKIIKHEGEVFTKWLAQQQVVPIVTALRNQAEEIRQQELTKVWSKLEHLDSREQEMIKAMSMAIVNKILHLPTVRLKQLAAHGIQRSQLDQIASILGIEEDTMEHCVDG